MPTNEEWTFAALAAAITGGTHEEKLARMKRIGIIDADGNVSKRSRNTLGPGAASYVWIVKCPGTGFYFECWRHMRGFVGDILTTKQRDAMRYLYVEKAWAKARELGPSWRVYRVAK